VSDWTPDTVKAYVDAMFETRNEAIRQALAANEKRLDALNEIRGILSDQQSKFITKTEAVALVTLVSVVVGSIIAIANFVIQHFK
jgi:hypothetical protein